MPESGGPTTQSGTYFQNTVAAWFLAQMLHDAASTRSENRVIRVRCEAPEEVDDVVVTFERGVHYVQAKEALSASESAWTGLWRHFWKQSDRIDLKRDRLILWGGQHTALFKGLQELVKRAQSVPSGPRRRQVAEFSGRLTQRQLGWLDGIVAIIRDYGTELAAGQEPAEITRSDIFELLQVVDVVVKGSAEEIEAQAVSTFLGSVSNAPAFATLRDLAADKARTRGSWDYEGLQAVLIERGTSTSPPDEAPSDLQADFRAKRCQDLAGNIQETLTLLKEYEDTHRLSSDPLARRRAAAEIEKLRADLNRYQGEYRELGCT